MLVILVIKVKDYFIKLNKLVYLLAVAPLADLYSGSVFEGWVKTHKDGLTPLQDLKLGIE